MKEATSLGLWLRQQRHALDLTQKELAQRVGCAVVTIHKIETGELHPSKEMAERLALCLGLAPEERAEFVRFARAAAPGQASAGVPSPRWSTPHRPNNLPFPTTQLIGRTDESVAVRKRLREGARLLTLVGPPGVGKTRLVLEVGYQMLDEYGDGVFFVSLVPITDPSLVAGTIARALSIPEARARPMAEQVRSYLRDKHLLLVLDNFEHVIEAAPLVTELLAACPWLTILATSRQPLRLHGERQVPVPPLAVPPKPTTDIGNLAPADALRYPAIVLFAERAEAISPDFALTDATAPVVAEICRRLDGLPLAIELIAARIKLFTPQMLLDRWQGSWILSTGGPLDTAPKQRTLHNAIDWSYQLLSEDEKRLLCRLAVFAGSTTVEAIEAICNHDGAFVTGMLDSLASLVDKSLVQRSDSAAGEARFVLLVMIRAYALERLAANGEEQCVRLKHAAYCQELAAHAREKLEGPEQLAWFKRLEQEHHNLRTALDWTLSRHPREERASVELGLRMAGDLFWFWSLRGHLREGLTWLERGLEVTQSWGNTLERAAGLYGAGGCAGYLGLVRRSNAHLDACVSMCRAILTHRDTDEVTASDAPISDRLRIEAERALGYALGLRGFFVQSKDRYLEALAELEESIAIFRRAGDAFGLALSLNFLGHCAGRNGDLQMARAALEESIALFRRSDNLLGVVLAGSNLVRLIEHEGDHGQAHSLQEREGAPPAVVQELGELLRINAVMWWLSYLAFSQGNDIHRFEMFRRSVMVQQSLGYQEFVWRGLYETAFLALEARMPARATRLAAAIQALQERLDVKWSDTDELDADLLKMRGALGEEQFTRVWTQGKAMTLQQTAAYALSGEE